ncbi:hypothetical protein VSS74_18885 [Conexibacter stalactiti]|uniref:Secreted protein n=1 Tax=Conexibacter stalactiti TaxID=1940611 RepID=A0ABU4HV47_9ACTN|nr:hypothetical protein [Conexibacter stalactiti]MDW5596420.1 hypothetical protein [Conexibacter stalactiti]MEC5037062.1 hypothetical protein [Conexibacter stalactiti]
MHLTGVATRRGKRWPRLIAPLAIVVSSWTTSGAALAATAEPLSAPTTITWYQKAQPALVPMANEIVPDMLAGGWRSYYVTTQQTYRCDTPNNLLTEAVDCTGPYVHGITSPEYVWHGTDAFPVDPPSGRGHGYDHKMGYHGVFGVAAVRDAAGRDHIVSVNHGENKNVVRPDLETYWLSRGAPATAQWLWHYQNTVFTQADARAPGYRLPGSPADCYSGDHGGVYDDCWIAYSGFVSTSNIASTPANGYGNAEMNDLGPAVWPKHGYTTFGSRGDLRRASHGLRHPSVIDGGDGYLYMYYVDTGRALYNDVTDRPTGRSTDDGIRVARSPKTSLGVGWSIWVQDTRSWEPALPAGVTAAQMSGAFGSRSPAQSRRLFESSSATFNVARVRDSRTWIGVEIRTDYELPECAAEKHWQRLALRLGTGPTSWDPDPLYLTGPYAAQFERCGGDVGETMAYPRLYANDGWSTKEVDASGFHIVGRGHDGQLRKVRVSLSGLTS